MNYLSQCYILERWTIDVKCRTIQDIIDDVIQVDIKTSFTLIKNSLMMQFLEVAKNGSKSKRKYEHLSHSLQRIHEEILAMDDEDGENPKASYLPPNYEANNLVQSNIGISLQDPLHVRSKGRPKSLRAKNPKKSLSKQPGTKRKCSICKEEGHNKSSCSSLKSSL